MKTLRLAILTFFTFIIAISVEPVAMATSDSGFFNDAFGMAGISSKGNSSYRELADLVYAEFRKSNAPFLVLNRGERPAAVYQDEFANYCLDDDFSDVVSWVTSGASSRKITFSCVLDEDFPQIRERLFVFTIRQGHLVDIQVVSADVAPSNSAAALSSSQMKALRDLPIQKPWDVKNETDKVIIAVSGAMVSGGITATQTSNGIQAKDPTSWEAGSRALASGLGAAVIHYVLSLAPASSALAGGGLSIALADMNDNIPDPLSGLPRGRLNRNSDTIGALGPISLRFTFKFW